jgi:hypothetical protein
MTMGAPVSSSVPAALRDPIAGADLELTARRVSRGQETSRQKRF